MWFSNSHPAIERAPSFHKAVRTFEAIQSSLEGWSTPPSFAEERASWRSCAGESLHLRRCCLRRLQTMGLSKGSHLTRGCGACAAAVFAGLELSSWLRRGSWQGLGLRGACGMCRRSWGMQDTLCPRSFRQDLIHFVTQSVA